jgi:AcrR family transcriptional regulator
MLAGVPAPQPVDVATGTRAPRMSPDERREMLVAATVPLITQHGPSVTTRQIAEAAGVAEGTIFRVFPDKEALVRAAVDQVLDPGPALAELAAIDPCAPLPDRVAAIVRIMQDRFSRVFNLMIALGRHGRPEHPPANPRPPAALAILDEIARVLGPDEAKFRCPMPEVVRIMRLLTFAGTHPLITDGQVLTADDITDVLLHGTLRHDDPPTDSERGQHRC